MVDRTVRVAGRRRRARARTASAILTIASIIQREARFEPTSTRCRGSSRTVSTPATGDLRLLQMDSTAQYGYGELHDGTVSSSAEALRTTTRGTPTCTPGLPVGPIANPGDAAIDAAMHPADGPWLYFVTVNLDTGETLFTATYAEHEQARPAVAGVVQREPGLRMLTAGARGWRSGATRSRTAGRRGCTPRRTRVLGLDWTYEPAAGRGSRASPTRWRLCDAPGAASR